MSYIGNTLPANFQSLPAVQRFNGDGSDTTFTLAAQIANDQSILVSVDGVTQDSNAYAVSGTTLTFTAAPSSGTGNIFVNTISPVGSTVVPPDGSVSKVKTDFYISQATAPSAPSEGDMWFNTSASTVSGIVTKAMSSYSGTSWVQMSNKFSATGGTETTYASGGVTYKVHTFTSSATFTFSGLGTVEYLVVAGGGGTGARWHSGGGGGGGYRSSVTGESSGGGASTESAISVTSGSYAVTVGAGGAGTTDTTNSNSGTTNGGNSVFSSITALGGGYGSTYGTSAPSGGSGGGSGSANASTANAAGTSGQGHQGGRGTPNSGSGAGGGGGGAGAAGADASSATVAGNGGNGVSSSINGTATYRAGGGGGTVPTGGTRGTGGLGGSNAGASGSANTGGGGGGPLDSSGSGATGRSGGSGIVIIRYAV